MVYAEEKHLPPQTQNALPPPWVGPRRKKIDLEASPTLGLTLSVNVGEPEEAPQSDTYSI